MHLGHGNGPPQARVMIVGEVWGPHEMRKGEPFVGPSGEELNRMLHEAGMTRSECFVTNVVNAVPPASNLDNWIPTRKKDVRPNMQMFRGRYVDPVVVQGFQQLIAEIELVSPNVIIALGNTALWALTGATGILKWRGSQLETNFDGVAGAHLGRPVSRPRKVIPSVHPAAVLREWSLRRASILDLRRASRERETERYTNVPDWQFKVRPTHAEVAEILDGLLRQADALPPTEPKIILDFDLETRAGHIACAGISWSRVDALCIPFMCVEDKQGYWPDAATEAAIVYRLYRLLTHSHVGVRGQNLLYDAQYTYRHWHFVPNVVQDTMIAHHSVFCGLKKSLDFIASLYCDHYVYWKDDGKTWSKDMSEDQLWRYNCIDCVRTRESGEVLTDTIEKLGLQTVDQFQQEFFWPVLECMQRGVAIDNKRRMRLSEELLDAIAAREAFFHRILGHVLNPQARIQMLTLFYEDLKQPVVMSRPKKGKPASPTLGKEALNKIWAREPLLRPLIDAIREWRSLKIFWKNFVMAPLDVDGRMRTSYNITGTKTFRFASRKNAFGSGTNLQNIPKGDEASEVDLEDDDEDDEDGVDTLTAGLHLPNVRKIFVPDPGYTIFDTDLSKADLRIVVWESDEREMKAMLREGKDPYIETAKEFYRDPSIRKTRADGSEDPRYRLFKSFCHGTHYLGTPHGLAQRLGLTVHEAERTQRWYLGKYPAIKRWQDDFKGRVAARRYVENIFGYRRYYFDRPDDAMFREAIAWVPQSTVALYINRIWMRVHKELRHVQILMQVHDSLVGQFPTYRREECLKQLGEVSQIVLPYEEPLVIPVGLKWSEKSWGDCE